MVISRDLSLITLVLCGGALSSACQDSDRAAAAPDGAPVVESTPTEVPAVVVEGLADERPEFAARADEIRILEAAMLGAQELDLGALSARPGSAQTPPAKTGDEEPAAREGAPEPGASLAVIRVERHLDVELPEWAMTPRRPQPSPNEGVEERGRTTGRL